MAISETKGIERHHLNDVLQGLLDTAPVPCGKPKKYWVMKMKRIKGQNKLPRGFKPASGPIEVEYYPVSN